MKETGQKKRRRKVSTQDTEEQNQDTKFIPEVELDVTKLPSRGLSYPKTANLKYRTYTFGEIRKASSSTISTEASIRLAMAGITANFPVGDLTLMDCLYIGILRKISSLNGLKFEVPFICTKCEQKSENVFTQQDIEFRDIPDEVTELPIVAEVAGKELHFSPLTVNQFLALSGKQYKSIYKEKKIDRVATQAITIGNMPFAEAYNFLYGIRDAEDIEVLTDVDKLLLHDIKRLKATCGYKADEDGEICGTINHLKLEGREVLLTPFRTDEKSPRTRIRFGTSPKPEPA